jgi:hypothetical protein
MRSKKVAEGDDDRTARAAQRFGLDLATERDRSYPRDARLTRAKAKQVHDYLPLLRELSHEQQAYVAANMLLVYFVTIIPRIVDQMRKCCSGVDLHGQRMGPALARAEEAFHQVGQMWSETSTLRLRPESDFDDQDRESAAEGIYEWSSRLYELMETLQCELKTVEGWEAVLFDRAWQVSKSECEENGEE